MALTEVRLWVNVRTATFFPVAFAAGILAGVAVGGVPDVLIRNAYLEEWYFSSARISSVFRTRPMRPIVTRKANS